MFALEWDLNFGTAQVRSYSSSLANEEMIISDIRHQTDLDILYIKDFMRKGCVGSGVCSDVVLLTRKKDRRKFAGKMYKHNIRELINEANIIKSCSTCTTIVNIIGIMISPKCLVLEYYRNGSLDIALQEDNLNMERGMETEFPLLQRLCYISDMCNAITHLHQRNICHRDIAMRNLLLSNDKTRILLSDFSLSRVVNNQYEKQLTFTLLVPKVSAPETFDKGGDSSTGESCERFYSLKSDIWRLGIAMFEIIAKTEVELKASYKLPRTFPNKYLPPTTEFNRKWELWGWILRCKEELPEKRPQCWEVLEGIETLIANPYNSMKKGSSYINRSCTSQTSMRSNVPKCYNFNMWGETTHVTFSNTVPYNVSHHRISSETSDISLSSSNSNIILPETESRRSNTERMSNTERVKRSMVEREKRQSKIQKMGQPNNEIIKKSCLQSTASVRSDSRVLIYKSDYLGLNVDPTLTEAMESNTNMWEDSKMSKKLKHCSTLTFAISTEPTNIAHCCGRHFFTNRAKELLVKEQIDNGGHLCTVESESFCESSSCECVRVDHSGTLDSQNFALSFTS